MATSGWGRRAFGATRILLINLLLLGSMILVLETLAQAWLRLRPKPRDPDAWNFAVDPSVGYGHPPADFRLSPNAADSRSDSRLYTLKTYGPDPGATNPSPLRLLVLGGSTSDPLGTQFSGVNGTWPDQLGRILARKGRKVQIANAATGGNTTSQELIRLIAVLHRLQPDLIVSMNGVNETYFAASAYGDPDHVYAGKMVLEALSRLPLGGHLPVQDQGLTDCRWFCFYAPAALAVLAKEYYRSIEEWPLQAKVSQVSRHRLRDLLVEPDFPTRGSKRAAAIWRRNVRSMEALARARGIPYLVILQPTLGLDVTRSEIAARLPMPEDAQTLTISQLDEAILSQGDYLEKLNYLYGLLRKECRMLPFCLDRSAGHLIPQRFSHYRDIRHLNATGNRVLAEGIAAPVMRALEAGTSGSSAGRRDREQEPAQRMPGATGIGSSSPPGR